MRDSSPGRLNLAFALLHHPQIHDYLLRQVVDQVEEVVDRVSGVRPVWRQINSVNEFGSTIVVEGRKQSN